MRNYCTLFDRNYLTRGLALYESLVKHSSEPFRMHVLAMDGGCQDDLRRLDLTNVQIVSLRMFEMLSGMASVRATRTWQEYCWTCASVFTHGVTANRVPLEEATYIDADCYFFSDPKQIFDEIGGRSIAIIPHRFESPKIATNGKYNVSWVTFRGEVGRRCLTRWAEQCREWCFYRVEPGRFGDQKYLDEWPELYGDAVAVIENPGAGLAPWNLQQYYLTEGPKVNGRPVVFYHAHEYQSPEKLTGYRLRPEGKSLIYEPYIQALNRAQRQIDSARIPA